jgi:dimethylsulfone monooxygenase
LSITADIFKGPLDPGGQPEIESPNKLLLGLFAWNVSCGATISKAVLADRARYRDYWQWPHASRLVQQAEQAGFDFEVPFGRYLGHGGEIGFNDEQLDVVASAAALSQITKNILLFSTVHVTYAFHPLHFARFGAQIDYLSDGRWGLNIVTGWFAEEYAMFSGSLNWLSHDERYAMADEFVTLMKWLWASKEPIDFQGKYYRSLGGLVKVKPTRRPRPILVSAGHSEAGIDFAAKHCEWLFCRVRIFRRWPKLRLRPSKGRPAMVDAFGC